jgi:CheY-like chemotaxis protein
MSMSEYTPQRLKSGKIKAQQLKDTEATIVVTSCHNCVDGLTDLIRHYKLDMQVTQLVNLVARALVLEPRVVEVPVSIAPPIAEAAELAGYRILVADDEPDFVTFVSTLLRDNGATVYEAFDGEQALAIARREMPDLITLDITMPGRSGDEVFEFMRHDPELQAIRVCVITGKPELRRLIYERPVRPPEGYVDKPVSDAALLLNVKRILEVKTERT